MSAIGLCVPPPRIDALGVAHKGYVWPRTPGLAYWCNIHVRFVGGTLWQRLQVANILTGPGGWNRVCGAQFVVSDLWTAPVRVTFEPGGSWSYPGTYGVNGPFDAPTLNLGWLTEATSERERRRVVLHEFGHALALMHTHEQPGVPIPWDKAKVYAFYRQTQGWPADVVESQVLTPLAEEVAVCNAYGPSIMSYGIPAELLTDPAWATERVTELTAGDIELAQMLYGPPPDVESQVYLPTAKG